MRNISCLIILIALTLMVIPSSFAQENLIYDGDFEESPHMPWGEWKDWGTNKRDFDNTEEAYSGAQSYKVTITKAASRWNSDIVLQEDITEIKAGGEFEASVYILIPENNPLSENVETYLEIIFYDGHGKDAENEVGKFQSEKYGKGVSQPQWQKVSISDTAPTEARECKVQLVVLPLPYLSDNEKADEAYSGVVYFDDMSLINKSE